MHEADLVCNRGLRAGANLLTSTSYSLSLHWSLLLYTNGIASSYTLFKSSWLAELRSYSLYHSIVAAYPVYSVVGRVFFLDHDPSLNHAWYGFYLPGIYLHHFRSTEHILGYGPS